MLMRVKVLPRSPFTSRIDSYTIFGAFCWGYKLLEGEKALKELLETFKKKPLFLISSPLPEAKEKLYFPMPEVEDGFGEIPFDKMHSEEFKKTYKLQKELKKLSYLPFELFFEFLEGRLKKKIDLLEKLRAKKEEFKVKLFEIHNNPQCSINRITWTTTGGILYNQPLYLYRPFSFLVYFFDKAVIRSFKSSLSLVPLGGNKSTGFGRKELFCLEEEKDEITKKLKPFLTSQSEKFVTLSPCFYDEDFSIFESRYQHELFAGKVENFYGKITKSVLKKKVVYLRAGAVLKVEKIKEFYGCLKSVLPEVYQYGFAFPLYFKNGGSKQ